MNSKQKQLSNVYLEISHRDLLNRVEESVLQNQKNVERSSNAKKSRISETNFFYSNC